MKWRRRTVIVAAFIVALSFGLVFATVAYLIHPMAPHATLTKLQSQPVRAGNQSYPGFSSLTIPGISGNESFEVGITLNGTATFCVISDPLYRPWELNYNYYAPGTTPGAAFPKPSCIQYQTITGQGTLGFTPTNLGNWDIITLNTSPSGVLVQFSPA